MDELAHEEGKFIHCGHCGSIMERHDDGYFDYTPADARSLNRTLDTIARHAVRILEVIPRNDDPNVRPSDVLARAAASEISAAFVHYYYIPVDEQRAEGEHVDITELAGTQLAGMVDDAGESLVDSEDIGTYLNAEHTALAFDFLADHLHMLLTGGQYRMRANYRDAEDRNLRTILKALDPGRASTLDWVLNKHHPNAPQPFVSGRDITQSPVFTQQTNVKDEEFQFNAHAAASDYGKLSTAADVLAKIDDLLSQGKNVRVAVMADDAPIATPAPPHPAISRWRLEQIDEAYWLDNNGTYTPSEGWEAVEKAREQWLALDRYNASQTH